MCCEIMYSAIVKAVCIIPDGVFQQVSTQSAEILQACCRNVVIIIYLESTLLLFYNALRTNWDGQDGQDGHGISNTQMSLEQADPTGTLRGQVTIIIMTPWMLGWPLLVSVLSSLFLSSLSRATSPSLPRLIYSLSIHCDSLISKLQLCNYISNE